MTWWSQELEGPEWKLMNNEELKDLPAATPETALDHVM